MQRKNLIYTKKAVSYKKNASIHIRIHTLEKWRKDTEMNRNVELILQKWGFYDYNVSALPNCNQIFSIFTILILSFQQKYADYQTHNTYIITFTYPTKNAPNNSQSTNIYKHSIPWRFTWHTFGLYNKAHEIMQLSIYKKWQI